MKEYLKVCVMLGCVRLNIKSGTLIQSKVVRITLRDHL
jgi:hypothetical protein